MGASSNLPHIRVIYVITAGINQQDHFEQGQPFGSVNPL